MQADVRAPTRRRMMADVGVTVQRYSLILYGTTQKLKLEPWEPETQRTVASLEWKPDRVHIKLRVENLPNGQVRARGKAWPAATPPTVPATVPSGSTAAVPALPRRFTAHVKRTGLRTFTTRGTVLLPSGLARAAACNGRVQVTVKAGKRTLSTRRSSLWKPPPHVHLEALAQRRPRCAASPPDRARPASSEPAEAGVGREPARQRPSRTARPGAGASRRRPVP